MKSNSQKEVSWLLNKKYSGKETKAFWRDVKRIKAGEPIDYVIGFTDFLGCKIDLSHKPLIPRQETAFWTKQAIDSMLHKNNDRGFCVTKVLDIFSGSGCVGLAVLEKVKNAKVVFVDNDKNAISQIKKNLKINFAYNYPHNLENTRVLQSDLFKNLNIKKYKNHFDFILANPPYISTKNRNRVEKSTLLHEPSTALFGGVGGLFYISKFLREAKKFLAQGGKIYMEFDGSAGSQQVPPQKNEIEKLLKKNNYSKWQFHKDQYKRWRWVEIHFTGILNRSKIE